MAITSITQQGTRVAHLGSRGCFGTVVGYQPQSYGCDPIHFDILVKWDHETTNGPLAGRVSRAGITSLREVKGL